MKLHNTLTRQTEEFRPINPDEVRVYACGPTVYDHVHIGNLSAYIMVDILCRTLQASGYETRLVMNFTDVDDKTILRSQEKYPMLQPKDALNKLTREYEQIFLKDIDAVGIDAGAYRFVRATESIEGMRALISELYDDGFAYITDDGVYFSIDKYRDSGKKYGQLSNIDAANTSGARIDNDEYDKESVHDFALWKAKKDNEPAWEFELDGHDISGRPGWHIECSVMSINNLGQPFDIHTGGIDHIFPHHENEIAQSTAGKGDVYAKYFVHNEHLLVDGKKMSKSLKNFYTIQDISAKGYDPLAFRLMVLQSHYRSPSNFTWDNIEAAQNALLSFQAWADMQFQNLSSEKLKINYIEAIPLILSNLQDDMKTPVALAVLNGMVNRIEELGIDSEAIADASLAVDHMLNLNLSNRKDISDDQKMLISKRSEARLAKDWELSDKLRDELQEQGISLRDTNQGTVWSRL